ncbi:hypothetical protein BO996_12440 [Delftia sp. HK171]|uniref:hypothetical protein n=1 Tax=Delftia sp. HK171 TaxID=1920191 RepID=UPI000903FBD5|nr:hypothetical protein [Delftia sp. HK171]APE48596.1 hypothetical protein BO996_12440 [Delftia sp. HK171]
MIRSDLYDPEALRLAATAPAPDDDVDPEASDEQRDLDQLCERWVAWKATRRFYGPSPSMGSILGQLSGTRTRPLRTDGPNAACSAELAAFHLAYTCQPDALDKQVFDLYYVHRVAPVKVAASALRISRKHFYSVLGDFRKRLYSASQSILAERMGP